MKHESVFHKQRCEAETDMHWTRFERFQCTSNVSLLLKGKFEGKKGEENLDDMD